MKTFEESGISA